MRLTLRLQMFSVPACAPERRVEQAQPLAGAPSHHPCMLLTPHPLTCVPLHPLRASGAELESVLWSGSFQSSPGGSLWLGQGPSDVFILWHG